jgi:hypothetical protein
MMPICLPSYAMAGGTTLTYIKKPSKLIALKTKLFLKGERTGPTGKNQSRQGAEHGDRPTQ